MTEGEYVINTFKKAFEKDRSKRICLYGLGKYTKLLLERLNNFNFVGVADFSYEKNIWEGCRVIQKEYVAEEADILVLIANPEKLHLIYKKVRELSEQIKIYTIEKNDIREEEQFHERASIEEALQSLEQYTISVEDRRTLARFQRKLLHEGKYHIQDVYSFINIFAAPWIFSYFAWTLNRIKESKSDMVLMASRDGYLFYRLFQLLPDDESLSKIKYFYTSRRCLSVASIESENDILDIARQDYKNDKSAFLKYCFGITVPLKEELLLSKEELALLYKESIFRRAQKERSCLEVYLEKEGIDKGSDILLFDFIGKGTMQYSLEKILGKSIDCLYYFKEVINESNTEKRTGQAMSYSGEGNHYMKKLFTQRHKSLFETIFTACHGMVENFTSEGNPILGGSKTDKSYFDEVERACVDYYEEMWKNSFPKELNLQLVDCMLELLEYDCIFINAKVKECFVLDDPSLGLIDPFAEGYLK